MSPENAIPNAGNAPTAEPTTPTTDLVDPGPPLDGPGATQTHPTSTIPTFVGPSPVGRLLRHYRDDPRRAFTTVAILVLGGFVPVSLVVFSFTYAQWGQGLRMGMPMLAAAHTFSSIYLPLVYLPSLVTAVLLWRHSRRRYPLLAHRVAVGASVGGVAWMVLVEVGMMTLPPMQPSVGLFRSQFAWPQLFLITLLAHVVFGIVLGIMAEALLRADDGPGLFRLLQRAGRAAA